MDLTGFKSYLKDHYPYITEIEDDLDEWSSNYFVRVRTSIPRWDVKNAVDRYDMHSYVSGGKVFYGAGDDTGETVYDTATVGEQIIDRFYENAAGFGLKPYKSHETCVFLKYVGDGIYRKVTHDDNDNLFLWLEFVK